MGLKRCGDANATGNVLLSHCYMILMNYFHLIDNVYSIFII